MIPHDKLVAALKMRISDGRVLNLIREWLQSSIEATGDCGRKTITRPM